MKKGHSHITITAYPAIICLLAAGCVSLKQASPVQNYHVLEIVRATGRPAADDGPILQVPSFASSPGFAKQGFVYRTGEVTYEEDFYNRFFYLPAAQVREQTVQWLKGSDHFRHVIDRSSKLRATHFLEGNVAALYGDFRDKKDARAVVELDLLLIDAESLHPRILFSETYEKSIPIEKASPEALVKGWEQGLNEILTEFEEGVGTVSSLTITQPTAD